MNQTKMQYWRDGMAWHRDDPSNSVVFNTKLHLTVSLYFSFRLLLSKKNTKQAVHTIQYYIIDILPDQSVVIMNWSTTKINWIISNIYNRVHIICVCVWRSECGCILYMKIKHPVYSLVGFCCFYRWGSLVQNIWTMTFLKSCLCFLTKLRLPLHCMRGSHTEYATMKQLTYHFFPWHSQKFSIYVVWLRVVFCHVKCSWQKSQATP